MKREVYIIGGGPSLQGFDFEQLRDKDTIAVNMAAKDVPEPTYCITADSGIFRKLQEGVFADIDTTWVLVTNPNHCTMQWRDGRFTHKNNGFVYDLFKPNMVIRNNGVEGIGFTFKDFKTGYNSGFCAFQLAVLLGYEKIHLLGFDFIKQNDKSHYHSYYKNRGISKGDLNRYYKNFVKAFETIEEQTDIEVISHSSISRLNRHIPYIPFEKKVISLKPIKLKPIKPKPNNKKSKKKLSILICTINGREKSLDRLLQILNPQLTDDVEVVIEKDNCKITTGEKRNNLLEKAVGEYIAFIDDDDLISDNYIFKILTAIKDKPDCCGIEGDVTFKKKGKTRQFIHSIEYIEWFEKDKVYYRCPNHLSPVKRGLALQTAFPHITRGEDKDYSLRLKPLLKTETYIKGPIYFYLAR